MFLTFFIQTERMTQQKIKTQKQNKKLFLFRMEFILPHFCQRRDENFKWSMTSEIAFDRFFLLLLFCIHMNGVSLFQSSLAFSLFIHLNDGNQKKKKYMRRVYRKWEFIFYFIRNRYQKKKPQTAMFSFILFTRETGRSLTIFNVES